MAPGDAQGRAAAPAVSGAPRLSVAVITRNEERNLPRLLTAVRDVADEIVVLDSGSTDATVRIAREGGARVVETDWPGYGRQKQRAIEACRGEWIVSLDADEAPDAELLEALRTLPPADADRHAAYEVDRLTEYQGEFIRHAWSPDWIVRVVRRGAGRFTDSVVHEKLEIDGRVGRLPGHLLHYSYDGLEDHYVRLLDYAGLGAQEMQRKGRRFRWHQLVTRPLVAFLQRLIAKRGLLDGVRGLLVAGSQASYVFWKYAFLFERERLGLAPDERRPPGRGADGAAGGSRGGNGSAG